ncbi:MAG: hypothetical protein OK455_00790 [Thaumarchaeota archaeon]|nr:hypothetical protein [Nitrososphaerota archaeon]
MRAPKVTTTTILIGAGVGLTLIVELLVLQAAVQGLSVSDWVSTTSTVPTTSASAALNSGRLYNVTFVEGQDGFGNY